MELAAKYLTGGFRDELTELENIEFTPQHLAETPSVILHAEVAAHIAAQAPVVVRKEEKLVGSAPLLAATRHQVPGWEGHWSISHTTADFGNAVTLGLSGLEVEVRTQLSSVDETRRPFCRALLMVIDAMRLWVARILAKVEKELAADPDCPNLRNVAAALKNVPENPPANFREAIQSLWLFFEFMRLCGNWSGLGRLDVILGGYLERDLAAGVITPDEARELLAHFWIKGAEWCFGLRKFNPARPDSGDAQFYQNVVLGGALPGGGNAENTVTFLILDVIEELHISDYPVAVRLNRLTSDRLLHRIAEVQLLGGGIVSVYNEETVLDGFRMQGYGEKESLTFTNDGCWEVLLPGRTNFGYRPFDALQPLQTALLHAVGDEDFEAIYRAYQTELLAQIKRIKSEINHEIHIFDRSDKARFHSDATLSLLMPSCRRNAVSYSDFGTDFTVRAIHAGGLPDVANSLLALRTFVFERQRVTLSELLSAMRSDWQGNEPLRLEILNSIPYYGNDDDTADAMLKKVYSDFSEAVAAAGDIVGVLTPAGVSTFGREIAFAPNRLATVFGKHAHEFLAPNLSPTPGTEKLPLTAVVNSYCKMDFTATPNGCPLDLRLAAGIHKAPGAVAALTAVLKAFMAKGGFYLQIDIVDPEMLKQAKADPDRFPNLVVRISGWSARFASLSEEWQDMIINRAALEAI